MKAPRIRACLASVSLAVSLLCPAAAAPVADDGWVGPMKKVHATFTGQPGTVAQIGDSITITMAFFTPLRGQIKNVPKDLAPAHEWIRSYVKGRCWSAWKGPEWGNNGRMTSNWGAANIDGWLKKMNPEVALVGPWRLDLTRMRPARGKAFTEESALSPTESPSSHVPAKFAYAFLQAFGGKLPAEADKPAPPAAAAPGEAPKPAPPAPAAAAVGASPGRLAAAEPPPAGGLTSLPVAHTEAVELTNGGFEDASEGWSRNRSFSVSPGSAHGGKACLLFKGSAAKGPVPSAKQKLPHLGPGVYTLRFWVKMTGITASTRIGGLRISIEYMPRAWPSTKIYSGTFDWQQVEFTFHLPEKMIPGSARLSVGCYGHVAAGEAMFDDFTLQRVAEPPIEAYLLYPNYRGYLPADGPQRVRIWVRVNKPDAKATPRVEAVSAGGKRVASVDLPAGTVQKVVELDASQWPLGRYELRAVRGQYAYPSYVLNKISPEQRQAMAAWFDRHNVLHREGRAVFPVGFYNTVRKFSVIDDGEIARLDKLAEAPVNFNINYTWWTCSLQDRRRYLGEMSKRGIWHLDTLMPFINAQDIKLKADEHFKVLRDLMPGSEGLKSQQETDQFLTRLAGRMRRFPGHGGWYVMDERPFSLAPKTFHQYTVLRAADPDHPTYGVSNLPEQLHFWRDAFDVVGVDPYPLMNMAAGRPLTMAAEWTRAAGEATHHSRPVWTVIQFFQGWSKDRWPTREELRTMSLMAIVEGARGLFYWSFGARGILWAGKDAEQYWRRAVEVTRELKRIEPALTAPEASNIVASVSDAKVRWRARAAQGKWYVFAYLPAARFADRAERPPTPVTFTLTDGRKVTRDFRPDTADWFEVPRPASASAPAPAG